MATECMVEISVKNGVHPKLIFSGMNYTLNRHAEFRVGLA
jgi:hypothetical protein